ncbi:hypothetical protein BD626DRAFT_237829 [Schizophyllum amplum]|uniref:Uncharacterized protein n=1 Tax=Schizophyllum amplum TaxID=97359 RepID=A0A550CJI7_9AGAR|nr:hypothetical protein BD626DRAFT_237829 [Auriculariopsis ampla]
MLTLVVSSTSSIGIQRAEMIHNSYVSHPCLPFCSFLSVETLPVSRYGTGCDCARGALVSTYIRSTYLSRLSSIPTDRSARVIFLLLRMRVRGNKLRRRGEDPCSPASSFSAPHAYIIHGTSSSLCVSRSVPATYCKLGAHITWGVLGCRRPAQQSSSSA